MIHRAIFGSVERFFGILIEHFAGRFPFWISPRQVRLIPVASRHLDYARKAQEKIKAAGFECDIDDSQESVSKKIRNAQISQVNYMLTVGSKEVEDNTVTVRRRDNVVIGGVDLKTALKYFQKEAETKALNSTFTQNETDLR
jgi:threonyl-tRNA synthetase